ncbi:MAG: site-specific integrase [Lachnospiraceae bacterium]|nr:site-specific integrase [Lachnospiraceae bacterium]
MKYDILLSFKEYIQGQLPPNTARTYYAAVVKLFKDIQFRELRQVDKEWIIQETTQKFKTKNEYSAVKNGLKWLAKYDRSLRLPSEEEFLAVSKKKRNFSKKPKKVIYLKPTQRKINQIQNERLRYAYRLAEISGLRVSELADLEAGDITLQEGKIFVRVKKGKGGHGGLIECRHDEYLYDRLPDYLQKYPEGKIFYSEAYMRECADKLGLECHDLRRIFAITTRNDLKQNMPVEEANEIVQQRMRHERFSTTKRYLFNRKLKMEYEKRKEDSE